LPATGATPEVIGVAIEMTQGPVVEALLERGFCVYGINPKQHHQPPPKVWNNAAVSA
jgi:hypothetical protein